MESAIIVGIVSVVTALITVAGGIFVALIANRKESENSAEEAMKSVTEARFTLKDEQILALERKVVRLEDRLEAKDRLIARLKNQLREERTDG